MTTDLHVHAESTYRSLFGVPDIMVESPGRINLIGEHTDYNQGFVLPAAVEQRACVAMGKRTDQEIHMKALNLNRSHRTTLENLSSEGEAWSAYLLGVVQQLQVKGHPLSGFNAVLTGDVPVGAGMSSSASVECATIFALNEMFGLGLEKMDLVRLAQRAENEFVGVKCGIMDMFASIMGKKDHAIRLDCRSLEYQYFPLSLGSYKLVLFDTQVRHSLAAGEYNRRRQECEEGVRLLQAANPLVQSLRDADMQMIEQVLAPQASSVVYNRCRYVVEENERLVSGCLLLEKNDIEGFGKKMFGSHAGLRDLYEVSCAELDLLVDLAIAEPAIAGARMMGGGFGGCTINLIREDSIDAIYQRFRNIYREHTGLDLKVYITTPQDGARKVDFGS